MAGARGDLRDMDRGNGKADGRFHGIGTVWDRWRGMNGGEGGYGILDKCRGFGTVGFAGAGSLTGIERLLEGVLWWVRSRSGPSLGLAQHTLSVSQRREACFGRNAWVNKA